MHRRYNMGSHYQKSPLLWRQKCFHGLPQKQSLRQEEEVLHLDVDIAKKSFCCNVYVNLFWHTISSTVFPKRNSLSVHIENTTVLLRRRKNAVLFYPCQTSYTPLKCFLVITSITCP